MGGIDVAMFKKNHSNLTFLIVNTVEEPYARIIECERKKEAEGG